MVLATSSKKPHRTEIADRQFPVRITVLASGSSGDWKNEQTRRWLVSNLGNHGYATSTAFMWSGERAVHIHLPNVFVAASLLLACPHLQLHGERYEGPAR